MCVTVLPFKLAFNGLRINGQSITGTNVAEGLELYALDEWPSNRLILCHPLLLLPSIFPSIRVFSIESALRIRWPKYWSFSFSISFSRVAFL